MPLTFDQSSCQLLSEHRAAKAVQELRAAQNVDPKYRWAYRLCGNKNCVNPEHIQFRLWSERISTEQLKHRHKPARQKRLPDGTYPIPLIHD